MIEGTVIVFAEPSMFENVRLGEHVPVEEEEMAKSLTRFEGEVGASERCCGD